MKLIVFILLLVAYSYGQYGGNNIANGSFELFSGTADDGTDDNFTSYAETVSSSGIMEASTDQHSGTYSLIMNNNTGDAWTGMRIDQPSITLSQSTVYRFGIYTKGDAAGTVRLYDSANSGNIIQTATGITGRTYTEFIYSFTTAANFTSLVLYLYGTGTNGDSLYWDLAEVRGKLDTLYVDTDQADETDNDSTKTLTEAFETRGAHSGGYFIIVTGTYDESVTVDSSFTKLEASGAATVTAIDFNSVTCTVDTRYLTITTATNDDNVTYIDSTPAATEEKHGYGGYLNRRGFGGW